MKGGRKVKNRNTFEVKKSMMPDKAKRTIGWGIIFLLVVFLYLFRLGENGFYNRDEERFALAAQEMLQDGSWIIPTIKGSPLVTKPIFFYLLILLPSYCAGAVSEFTTKLPSALAGLAGLGITFLFGKELWNKRAGLLSALILATSYGYFWQSRIARVDTVLTFFITSTLFCVYKGFRSEAVKTKRRYYLLSYMVMALATLTKGPIGIFLPLTIILIFLTFTKNLNKLREMVMIRGVFIYLLITVSWFLFLSFDSKLGIVLFKRIFFQENLIRYQTLSKNVRPFYYYLFVLMGGLSLWCWILPGAITYTWPKEIPREREKYLLPLIWFVFVLCFFSFAPFKRDHYLTPLYPSAALIIGRAWDYLLSEEYPPTITLGLKWGVKILFFLLLGGAPVYACYIAYRFPDRMNPYFICYLIFLIISAYAGFILFNRQKPLWSFGCIFLQSYLFYLLLISQVLPYPTEKTYQSFKVLAQRMTDIMQPNEKIIAYKFWKPGLDFYLHTPISQVTDPAQLDRELCHNKRIYCLIKSKSYNKIRPYIQTAHWIVGEGKYGHREILVISNRAYPSLPP
jgi:4-amino-4-deoxy-L-arabinose transferase-like glycosyltransferase